MRTLLTTRCIAVALIAAAHPAAAQVDEIDLRGLTNEILAESSDPPQAWTPSTRSEGTYRSRVSVAQQPSSASTPGTQTSGADRNGSPAAGNPATNPTAGEKPSNENGLTAPPVPSSTLPPVADSESTGPKATVEIKPPNPEQLETFRKQVEAEPDEATRTKLEEILKQTEQELARCERARLKAAEHRQSLQDLDFKLDTLRQRIATQASETDYVVPEKPLPELEAELTALQQTIADFKENIKADKESQKIDTARLVEIESRLKAIPNERSEANNQLLTLSTTEDLASELTAGRLRANLVRLRLETESLESERALLQKRRDEKIFALSIEFNETELRRYESHAALLLPVVEREREQARRREVKEARDAIESYPEVLRPAAAKNQTLAEEASVIAGHIDTVDADDKAAQEILDDWADKEAELEIKVDETGMTQVLGLLLRSIAAQLPTTEAIATRRLDRYGLLSETQVRQFQIERELDELDQVTAPLEYFVPTLTGTTGSASAGDDSKSSLPKDARELLAARRERLESLKSRYATFNKKAIDTAQNEDRAIATIASLRAFIQGRMLWTQSHPTLLDFGRTASEWTDRDRALTFSQPRFYAKLLKRFLSDLSSNPVAYVLLAFFGVTLLGVRQYLKVRIRRLAKVASSRATTSVEPLLRTVGLTIADAAVWPGLLAFLALRLAAAFADDPEIAMAAAGLVRLAIALFLVEFVHDSCAPGALAEVLGVPTDVTRYVRRKIFRLEVIAGPLAAIVVVLHTENESLSMQLVERGCFIAAVIFLAKFANQMLRRSSPIMRLFVDPEVTPWLSRLQPAIWFSAMFTTISLAVMSIVGYHNTAIELLLRLEQTIWLGMGLLLVRLVLAMAIALRRRRIRYAAIRERVEAEAAAREAERDHAAAADAADSISQMNVAAEIPVEMEEDSETAVERLTGQSQRLIATVAALAFLGGTYVIWADVLPGLEPLTEFAVTEDESVTVGTILAGLIAVLITITAARNLPGLIEFSVLERLGLDRSVRYAMTTILSYAISLVGLMVAGHLAGLTWSSVQWMAAGLTVGLGFGLQEIFANFVSGLIIFIEQPIRVGDIVTIDDVTGVVSRIRIRATTITNWDRKEYIVPNKEFITGRLLNWTLSDTTNRLVLNVGIAYGSDSEHARQVLLNILEEHELILADPAPMVTLEALGDSSLNFTIRCYLASLDNRLSTTHELYTEIHRRFGTEGIEIPFPQRDLHIRTGGGGIAA